MLVYINTRIKTNLSSLKEFVNNTFYKNKKNSRVKLLCKARCEIDDVSELYTILQNDVVLVDKQEVITYEQSGVLATPRGSHCLCLTKEYKFFNSLRLSKIQKHIIFESADQSSSKSIVKVEINFT